MKTHQIHFMIASLAVLSIILIGVYGPEQQAQRVCGKVIGKEAIGHKYDTDYIVAIHSDGRVYSQNVGQALYFTYAVGDNGCMDYESTELTTALGVVLMLVAVILVCGILGLVHWTDDYY